MSANPFTPAFGGLPQVFFGRRGELAFIESALDDEISPHKAFFITGNRGCGKTTLLERASRLANKRRWLTIDVHSAHAAQAILEALAGTEQRKEKRIAPNVLGSSAGGVATTTTTTYTEASLPGVLMDKARSLTLHRGIFITVDEMQKVPEEDAESLCAAIQLSLRKGLPVMLLMAGLPGSKEKVAGYRGCTFMQRAHDMQIGCMQVDETLDAFRETLALVPEVAATDEALWEMGVFSQGYPYLMQLIGYYLVERAQEQLIGSSVAVGCDLVKAVEPIALDSYRANVLEPILGNLPETLSTYLRAMDKAEQPDGKAGTGDIADALGKDPTQVSSYRQRLIERRLIEADGRGYVRFTLPHIREHFRDQALPAPADPSQQWNRYRSS